MKGTEKMKHLLFLTLLLAPSCAEDLPAERARLEAERASLARERASLEADRQQLRADEKQSSQAEVQRESSPSSSAEETGSAIIVDRTDPITDERIFGFFVISNENESLGLKCITFGDGPPQIQIQDAGFRLWMPDDLFAENRSKAVMFRSDSMSQPLQLDLVLFDGDTDYMSCKASLSDVRRLFSGGTLTVRIMSPQETFTFDTSGSKIRDAIARFGR